MISESIRFLAQPRLTSPILVWGIKKEAIHSTSRAMEQVLGAEHPDTLRSRNNLANALWAQGKYAEAERGVRAVLAVMEQVLGTEHPEVFLSCANLAFCLEDQGKLKEASEFVQRAEMGLKKVLGAKHPYLQRAQQSRERIEAALKK